jgi:hypothetical protein
MKICDIFGPEGVACNKKNRLNQSANALLESNSSERLLTVDEPD